MRVSEVDKIIEVTLTLASTIRLVNKARSERNWKKLFSVVRKIRVISRISGKGVLDVFGLGHTEFRIKALETLESPELLHDVFTDLLCEHFWPQSNSMNVWEIYDCFFSHSDILSEFQKFWKLPLFMVIRKSCVNSRNSGLGFWSYRNAVWLLNILVGFPSGSFLKLLPILQKFWNGDNQCLTEQKPRKVATNAFTRYRQLTHGHSSPNFYF